MCPEIKSSSKKIELFCALNFILLVSIGLNYFFEQNKDYQFQAPFIIKIIPDLLFILIFIFFGFRKKIVKASIRNTVSICQLITVLIILTHLFSRVDLIEWMHFYFRNYILHSLAFFILPSLIRSQKHFIYFYKLFVKYLLILSVASLLLYILGISYEGRFISFFKDPLRSSYINTAFILIFILPEMAFASRNQKILYINFFLIFLCILLGASFGAIIVLIISILFLFLGYRYFLGKKFKFRVLSVFAFLVAIGSHVTGFLNILENRFLNMIYNPLFNPHSDPLAISTSISSRLNQYLLFFNSIQNESVASLLFGNYSAEHIITSDSNYLQIFYNFGFIGLVTFLAMNFYILKTCFDILRNYKKNVSGKNELYFLYCLGFSAFLLTMVIFGFNFVSITTQFPFSYIYFLLVGGVFAIRNLQNKKLSLGLP